jgi:hypothetical protein
LFGFTHEEAEAEVKRYRSYYRREIQREPSEGIWDWKDMQQADFDWESYNYWVNLWSHSDCSMEAPLDAQDWLRHIKGTFTVFLLKDIDEITSRLRYAPLARIPRIHMVHDWKGVPHKAVVLREEEEWEMMHSLPQYFREGENVHFTGQLEVIPMNWAFKPLHEHSLAPYVKDPTLPQFRLNQGEKAKPAQDEYPV